MAVILIFPLILASSVAVPLTAYPALNRNCVLPPYPAHGSYMASGVPLEPGQAFDSIAFNLICDAGYRVLGRMDRFCVRGVWSEDVGTCVRFCNLAQDPTVVYQCLNIVNSKIISSRPCQDHEPDGTTVCPVCRLPLNSNELPYMHCIDGTWDYIPNCPKVKPGRNITIIYKDKYYIKKETVGEIYISDLDSIGTLNNNNENNHQIINQNIKVNPDVSHVTPVSISLPDFPFQVIVNPNFTQASDVTPDVVAPVSDNPTIILSTPRVNKTKTIPTVEDTSQSINSKSNITSTLTNSILNITSLRLNTSASDSSLFVTPIAEVTPHVTNLSEVEVTSVTPVSEFTSVSIDKSTEKTTMASKFDDGRSDINETLDWRLGIVPYNPEIY